MLYMYHYWANMILYIVYLQFFCVPALRPKMLKKITVQGGQNRVGRVTTCKHKTVNIKIKFTYTI